MLDILDRSMVNSGTGKAPQDIWDVVIIGLGPTGLTLAHLLGRRGLKVLALEREPQFYGNARAVYTDDECMRIFQATGFADELDADMIVDCPVQWVLKDGSVLGQLRRFDRPNGWPMSNFFYQPFLETRMEELLSRYPNVTKLRGRDVVGFDQVEGEVIVTHVASEGVQYGQPRACAPTPQEATRVRARWLVACDGGRSSVRSSLGIKMTGKSFPEPWLFPAHPLFQFLLRSRATHGVVSPAQRPSPLRVHADAGPDPRIHGRSGDGARLPRTAHRRRQGRGVAPAGLHLQCADRRALAGGARAARRRRRAHDAAIHGAGHEFGRARCL